jgi:hypothetical protein
MNLRVNQTNEGSLWSHLWRSVKLTVEHVHNFMTRNKAGAYVTRFNVLQTQMCPKTGQEMDNIQLVQTFDRYDFQTLFEVTTDTVKLHCFCNGAVRCVTDMYSRETFCLHKSLEIVILSTNHKN